MLAAGVSQANLNRPALCNPVVRCPLSLADSQHCCFCLAPDNELFSVLAYATVATAMTKPREYYIYIYIYIYNLIIYIVAIE